MNRPLAVVSKLVLACLAVVAVASLSGCAEEVAVAPPPQPAVAVGIYPPDAYIATAAPVYYNGVPSYYYGGRWYYRNAGAWAYYGAEPAYLASRRGYGYGYRGGVRYNV